MPFRLPSLRYRSTEPGDLAALGTWLAGAGLGVPEEVKGRSDWSRRLFSDPHILCRTAVTSTGQIAGFYRLDLAPDRSAEITLIVAPSRRRKGVGQSLLDHALEDARRRGLRYLVAVIQAQNEPARHFFEGAGFAPCDSHLPGYLVLRRLVHRAAHQ
ncbi:MAG: GNAT family N-acetyltransferase, partial [Planctomycetaceae bacterium]|nr:GNAT family N-acetyltransferase [Planctomycetaceae bacterium]